MRRLTAYSWPGNGKEIENLCKYVYCFHSEGKLTIRDLPAYIRLQMAKKTSLLSPLEKRVLQTVAQNPKTGLAGLRKFWRMKGSRWRRERSGASFRVFGAGTHKGEPHQRGL